MLNWIKGIVAKLFGKDIGGGDWAVSKAKVAAIVYVVITGLTEISKAYGHPIVIPDMVYKFLEGAGLWAFRDAIKA